MAKNTILIKSTTNVFDEKVAAAAITPGHLIERTSADKVQKHSTGGGSVLPMFALEDENQGNDLNHAYEAAERVKCWIPGRGDQVTARVNSDSEDLSIGDFVESAGDGTVRKHDAASSASVIERVNSIVGRAVEAITAGSAGTIEIV